MCCLAFLGSVHHVQQHVVTNTRKCRPCQVWCGMGYTCSRYPTACVHRRPQGTRRCSHKRNTHTHTHKLHASMHADMPTHMPTHDRPKHLGIKVITCARLGRYAVGVCHLRVNTLNMVCLGVFACGYVGAVAASNLIRNA